MRHSLKVDFYDNFKCIADQCSLCCCKGWDISVDSDTYSRWENDEEQKDYLCKNLIIKKYRRKAEASIRMGTDKCCPFLNDKGLCKMFIDNGENYQPKTCRTFPRIENSMGEWEEYSLSCACPEVVDIINRLDGKMNFLFDGDSSSLNQAPLEFTIRKNMLSILGNTKFSLKDRILLTFHMLCSIRIEPVMAMEIISRFQNENYLSVLSDGWSEVKIEPEDTLQETNELFMDITMNYRKEKYYKAYLKEICEEAEELDITNAFIPDRWKIFCKKFENYEKLFENCMITKIFANCNSEKIDELILAFQMIVTEYLMVRHSAFLKSLIDQMNHESGRLERKKPADNSGYLLDKQEMYDTNIRNYIVVYSRIIEYNQEGIREFWKESFDEAIWEFGYMLLLN